MLYRLSVILANEVAIKTQRFYKGEIYLEKSCGKSCFDWLGRIKFLVMISLQDKPAEVQFQYVDSETQAGGPLTPHPCV